ncbi:MAG: excinuclease ABC subunit UvrC [bacterium]
MIDIDEAIHEKLALIPKQPGVYIFKDDNNAVLYVGKAVDLNSRVRSYFTASPDVRPFINFLKPKIKRIEFLLTDTEKEALLLENNLIKQYKPKYNIRLKDDKTYVNIRISTNHKFPGIQVVRRPVRYGSLIFGPYSSAYAARETVKLITALFQLRTCSDIEFKNRVRPCLKYQIKRCSGPCVNKIQQEEYNLKVKQAQLFLEGRMNIVIKQLKEQMKFEADQQNFEKAAQIRDTIFSIEKTIEQQKVEIANVTDIDVFNMAEQGKSVVINGLFIRNGQLLNSTNYLFRDTMLDKDELLSTVISQYYENGHFIPDYIYLPFEFEDMNTVQSRLSDIKGKEVTILVPRAGKKLDLVLLSAKNAEEYLRLSLQKEAISTSTANALKELLHLKNVPVTIECFDNSNISGTNSVSSMVRFENGVPVKAKYRHYRLKQADKPDDYAMMHEVLSRRYKDKQDLPSLIIVDGGKGQLSIALDVLKSIGIDQPDVIGIAKIHRNTGFQYELSKTAGSKFKNISTKKGINKEEERVYLPGKKDPIQLASNSEALMLLKRVRDEAHRFAVTYHRRLRTKSGMASILDGIPGVSEKRKRLLLSIFSSIEEIKNTTPEQITERTGIPISVAREVHNHLIDQH